MKNTQLLIKASYALRNRKELKFYKDFKKNFRTSIHTLEEQQLEAFINLFTFCKRNVPYYDNL